MSNANNERSDINKLQHNSSLVEQDNLNYTEIVQSLGSILMEVLIDYESNQDVNSLMTNLYFIFKRQDENLEDLQNEYLTQDLFRFLMTVSFTLKLQKSTIIISFIYFDRIMNIDQRLLKRENLKK
jgi:hypothetical protein